MDFITSIYTLILKLLIYLFILSKKCLTTCDRLSHMQCITSIKDFCSNLRIYKNHKVICVFKSN